MTEEIIRQRPGYVVTRGYGGREVKHRRFLCVGGPNDGDMRAEPELNMATRRDAEGYRPFNNGGRSSHSRIFVWTRS